MDNPLFFIALIAALLVVAVLLPRWIRRSTRAAGERTGRHEVESRLAEILEGLGTTVVLHAPESTVRALVDEVVRTQPRMFTALPDGAYGIRFIDPDDAVVRLVETEGGTRLQVERFREYLGRPNTSQFWEELRSRVVAAATTRGIPTSAGPVLAHRRDETTASWTLQ